MAQDVVQLGMRLPTLVQVYRGKTLDATLRERIMVAVSRVNACAGCTVVHERWALRAGVATEELEAIGLGDLARLDQRSRAAVVFASALAEARFRTPLDHELLSSVRGNLTRAELRGVEAVARLIALANLTVNSTKTAPFARYRTRRTRTYSV